MTLPVTAVLAVLLGVVARGQEMTATRTASGPASSPKVRFAAVDVVVNSGDQPLAAYQFELAAEIGRIRIVGIEGGEHAAFEQPPYYDPAALRHDRVIIAAFNTGRDLPTGATRVARVHLQVLGERDPEYVAKLQVAASAGGEAINNATVSIAEGGAQ